METMSAVRAFDEAVRRKPLAFAADAVGLWQQWRAGAGCKRESSTAEPHPRGSVRRASGFLLTGANRKLTKKSQAGPKS